MQGTELFGVVVRTIGLLAALRGIHNLMYVIIKLTAMSSSKWKYPKEDYISAGFVFTAGGIFLLLAADSLVKAVYR
jgi:hypothetical protein